MAINKKSEKIRKISRINEYLVKTIDETQSIKRYLRYLTESPLSQTSMNSSGITVYQADLVNSLKVKSTEGGQCLWKGSFKEEMINQEQAYIFVHTYAGNFRDVSSKLRVAINILTPSNREDLKHKEKFRSLEISEIINDLFDGIPIVNDKYIDIGDVKLNLVNYDYGRLSKTNNITVTTLTYEADIITMGREY